MKTLFIPCHSKRDPIPVLKENIDKLDSYKRIGIISTVQHSHSLDDIKKFLESKGKKAFIGGEILGCRQDNAKRIENKIDAFLYIGSGRFHPLGVSLKTKKPVLILNPYSRVMDKISEKEKNTWIRKRKGRISRALSAKTFGILISTKQGQFNLKKTLEIKKKIEDSRKKALLFAGDEITPDKLLAFKVDAWVNTACPRLVDDPFDKPVLNPEDLKYIL